MWGGHGGWHGHGGLDEGVYRAANEFAGGVGGEGGRGGPSLGDSGGAGADGLLLEVAE